MENDVAKIEDYEQAIQGLIDDLELGETFELIDLMGALAEEIPKNERNDLGGQFSKWVEAKRFAGVDLDGINRSGRQNRYIRVWPTAGSG
jgi:hypothetical protein